MRKLLSYRLSLFFFFFTNHKNYNFLVCDWFKTPIFHLFTCQVVIGQSFIGQFVIGQFNKPITFKVVV